ncbi:MAG: hypothetical protein ACR2J8_05555, partial [Thermomicrobiales bacterium]
MTDPEQMISPPPRPAPKQDVKSEPKADHRVSSGRSRSWSVLAVLAAGLAVLAGLVLFLMLSGRNKDVAPPVLICLPIGLDVAETAVMNGDVARLHVLTERGKPEVGPIAITLDLDDTTCRELPKGVQGQDSFYRLIGLTTVYNQTRAGEERINVLWEEQTNIPMELLATSTSTPEATATLAPPPPPTALPPVIATAIPPTAVPAAATAIPPTATALPPTATTAPPTPTAVPPTATIAP